jgi:serine/threonine protein kinase/tetratricopeptide (TPR) repeat protein
MTPPIEKVLFLAASALTDETERRLLLDQACGEDKALRKRVEDLFAIQEAASDYFEPRPPETASVGDETDAQLGPQIGRYRIIRRIGEGGCGVVYLAEQVEPVRREVALKIIRLGMDTENVIARFEAERQALAQMDHPHIARVLDAGATKSGRPFFVMEFVDGEKLTDFCDSRRFGLRQRLELFVQLCLAIQHAHQKGVIHRDIKPSNILVRMHDGAPIAKVIDFGIAMATTGRPGDRTALTLVDQFIGTPAYLSPEMAAGNIDLDTRSDIHSLGIVLHELLTGATPFDFRKAGDGGIAEIRRILREEAPPAPSVCLASLASAELDRRAALRGTEPAKLLQSVRGELDWIALKAMDRERDRRYETAYGLALDVRRHLANEPVSAGPPARLYRFSKFVRRNRVAVTSGILVAVTLTGGFGTSSVMFLREKQARAQQERLRSEAEVARANEAVLRTQAEHRELIAQAAVRLSHGDAAGADRLLSRVPFDQAPLSLEAAQTYSKVGEWHLFAGRWREATDRFATFALVLPNVDPSDSDAISITLLPAVATLCLAGDTARYAVIRATALDRFGGTTQPVVAEQVLKACLLTPATPEIAALIRALAERLENAVLEGHADFVNSPSRVAWSCFALGLVHYRQGDFVTAHAWAVRCLSEAGINPSRDASTRCLLAMIHARLGRAEEAGVQLASARSAIDAVFSQNLKFGNVNSFWFDWVAARVLLREASAVVRG